MIKLQTISRLKATVITKTTSKINNIDIDYSFSKSSKNFM